MSKPSILIQLDVDPQASSFDAVVAIDSGVDRLLQHAGVTVEQVQGLVHGAIFTRGPADLQRTAIFVGGTSVSAAEQLLEAVQSTFFGPMRVSVMLDANGANTTAAAAVISAARHIDLSGSEALVLAATGSVGQRVVRLLAAAGARVTAASRSRERAESVCDAVRTQYPQAQLKALGCDTSDKVAAAVAETQILIAAGAAGVQLATNSMLQANDGLVVAVDLNAVPPLGLEGVEVFDKAEERERTICYGAVGVGGTKMKIHKAALRKLFEANDQVFDAEQVFEIGRGLE